MQVYFARSIRGQHAAGEKVFFEAIYNTIKSAGHMPAMETKTQSRYLNHVDQNKAIYERDLEWIDNSQAMIAEVSNPSLGVGFEVAYALHVRKIPVFAVAYKDTNVSAMIQGCLDVFYYRDQSDLTAYCKEFLDDVADRLAHPNRNLHFKDHPARMSPEDCTHPYLDGEKCAICGINLLNVG